MSAVRVIIPARLASSRLPGKVLLPIAGKSIVQHVYERVLQSTADSVVIAVDNVAVAEHVASFGAEYVMTAERHQSGTDRIAEAAKTLGYAAADIIVNVQADQPLFDSAYIDQIAKLLDAKTSGEQQAIAQVATLSTPITDKNILLDTHVTKVVCNQAGNALYFSRAAIPYDRDNDFISLQNVTAANNWQRHLGIYAYRNNFLQQIVQCSVCPIESLEALEQLRILWHGYTIKVAQAVTKPAPDVDTAEDFALVTKLLETA